MNFQNTDIVKQGTYLYAHTVVCDVRIIKMPIRYGTGDYDDPPEIAEDHGEECFYVWYGSMIQRGLYNAGGGGFSSLEAAIEAVEQAPGIGHTVQWSK